ncbi:MAG: Fic family protein [Spirochaetia bacterium]|nr:Fic family protein [Spirochaetia bacterium]MBR5017219.1 Fic family protein [Spirochaetia bacterium]
MKELDFEQYIRHTDASKKEKKLAWSTAIGLQQVDGLKPSEYLYETAKRNIEGELSFEEAKKLIDSYYRNQKNRLEDERTEEADKVSSRIAQLLSEPSFNFTPYFLLAIHKRLFEGIYRFAGKIRDYDITKREWILDGDTVMYGAAFDLDNALIYDFKQEEAFDYSNPFSDATIKHITFFVSRLWQIHPFGEGNTRTTAVFVIKYLRSLGYKADNDIFADNSWYFRNALVRANYTNVQKGIRENSIYLERFFRNLLLGEHNELKNRYTHIRYTEEIAKSSEKKFGEKQKSSEIILTLLNNNAKLSARKIAEEMGISSRAVEKQIAILVKKGILKHEGPSKGGHWEVLR